ncbi:MAG: hypothetical protein ABFC24_04940 [Methanoregulaceae archaeon]
MGDKKGAVSILAALVIGWVSYSMSSPFFRQQLGTLMGVRFSDMVSLFYAVTSAGIVFVLLMFFWREKEGSHKKTRIVRVKRFKL